MYVSSESSAIDRLSSLEHLVQQPTPAILVPAVASHKQPPLTVRDSKQTKRFTVYDTRICQGGKHNNKFFRQPAALLAVSLSLL